jgi:hypothetical protein
VNKAEKANVPENELVLRPSSTLSRILKNKVVILEAESKFEAQSKKI